VTFMSAHIPKARSLSLFCLALPALGSALLTGCAGFQTTAASNPVAAASVGGSVFGGQQPVTGSRVYLYAAGTKGYGYVSKSLLGTGPSNAGLAVDFAGNSYTTSGSDGSFTITGNYDCAAAGSGAQVYSAISLLAALGTCTNLTSNTRININEVSTAAGITALQQFIVDPTHLGTSPGNLIGLQNAFLQVTNLVDPTSGNARSTPASGTGSAPQAKVNTLADILSPCVNSSSPSSQQCSSLFTAAAAGGTAPSDVANAMLMIAQHPGRNVPALFSQSTPSSPFSPSLATAPNDFSLAVSFTGGGLIYPGSLAIDASGNGWTSNCPSCSGLAGVDSLVGFSPQGTVLSGPLGFTSHIHNLEFIAFDDSGDLWSVNDATTTAPDEIVRMDMTGTVAPGFPFRSADLGFPIDIAIDTSGNAWVTNYDLNSLLGISSTGTEVAPPVTSPSFSGPGGIGIDGGGNVFTAGETSGSILKVNLSTQSKTVFMGPGLTNPYVIAIDNFNYVWTLNDSHAFSSITGSNGTPIASNVLVGHNQAAVIAIDGVSTGWVANCRATCPGSNSTSPDDVLHFDVHGNNLNASDGLQDPHLSNPGNAAIDASGNVWVSSAAGQSLTLLVGVAAPVATPRVHATILNEIGVRP
jgi:hypothetical protein